MREPSAMPNASTWIQRLIEATQSAATTGELSWNFSPSRSVMVQVSLSSETVWPAAICGCGAKFSSLP